MHVYIYINMYVCICICIYIYPHIYTASVNTPIRRYTDRCVYADTPIAVFTPIRRSLCLQYVYGALGPRANPKQTLNQPEMKP